MPRSISDTIPSITANSSVNVNFPIEHVISTKPNKDSLDPPAPVRTTCDLANLLLTLILSHNDFEIQLRNAPESTLEIKL